MPAGFESQSVICACLLCTTLNGKGAGPYKLQTPRRGESGSPEDLNSALS